MRKYSYGTNGYYKTASIFIEDAPWYIFALDTLIERICTLIPSIPLPPIKMKLSEEDAKFSGNEYSTWNEWYGDTSAWFCAMVHTPIMAFCNRYINFRSVDIDYNKLKEATIKYDEQQWPEYDDDDDEE